MKKKRRLTKQEKIIEGFVQELFKMGDAKKLRLEDWYIVLGMLHSGLLMYKMEEWMAKNATYQITMPTEVCDVSMTVKGEK